MSYQSPPLSLREDVFSIDDIPSPRSLKSALRFIEIFCCPPAAPTNLRLPVVGKDSISIEWDNNADNEDGFEVVWRGRRPAYQHDNGSKNLNEPNRESFTLTGLYPSYEYCIRVRAFSAGGKSGYSKEECATTPETSQPEPAQGFSEIHFFNCSTDRRSLVNIWRRDLTTNSSWEELDSLPFQGTDNVSCPPASASPFTVSLPEEHAYLVVAVDPNMITCVGNDPESEPCQRYIRNFIGNPNGSSFQVNIP